MKPILRRSLRIAGFSLLSLVLLVLLVWTVLFVGKYAIYSDYFAERQIVEKIPGISSGFCPQGITYIEEHALYIHSGYRGDDTVLYVARGDDDAREVTLFNADGTPTQTHGGGLTHAGELIYVASADGSGILTVFRLSDLLAVGEDGGSVTSIGNFVCDNRADFCYADETSLYVGEFYRPETKYVPDESHAYTTPEGEKNRAIVSRYAIAKDGSVTSEHATYRISIPAQVQGFVIKDGYVAISTSWGVNSSYLTIYEGLLPAGEVTSENGKDIPLYYLGSKNQIKRIKMPAFSEELELVNGRLVISFESAANKYIIGKPFFADKLVSYPFP